MKKWNAFTALVAFSLTGCGGLQNYQQQPGAGFLASTLISGMQNQEKQRQATAEREIRVSMFPAAGPLRDSGYTQEVSGAVVGVGTSGQFVFVRPDNVACEGRWTTLQTPPKTTSLMVQYQDVIGISTSVEGMVQGLALGSCSNGASFQVEYYAVRGTDNGFGAATDSDGNIYKLIF